MTVECNDSCGLSMDILQGLAKTAVCSFCIQPKPTKKPKKQPEAVETKLPYKDQ